MENGNFNFNGTGKEKSPWLKVGLFGIFVILVLSLIFGWGGDVRTMFYAVLTGSAAIFIGALIAFLFSRFVDFLEKKVMKNAFVGNRFEKGLKRTISLFIVFLCIVAIIAILMWLFVPRVIEIIKELIENTDIHVGKIKRELTDLLEKLLGQDLTKEVTNFVNDIVKSIETTITELGPRIIDIGTTVVTTVGLSLISILFAILMLKDKEKINTFFNRVTYANSSKQRAAEIIQIKEKSTDILYNYFLSKFIEIAILSVLIGVTFLILGVPYAWPLAILISVFNFIPYVGVLIGLIPALLVTIIFGTLTQALYVAIAAVVIVVVVTSGITPFIVGKQIKISGLLVGASILIGGAAFGMLGMLFAPPIFAIVGVVWSENIEVKEKRKQLQAEQAVAAEAVVAAAQLPAPEVIQESAKKKTTRKTADLKSAAKKLADTAEKKTTTAATKKTTIKKE